MLRTATLVVLFTALAACNAPSPYFSGVPATRIAVDGSVFDVRVNGHIANTIRVNSEYAPRLGPIKDRAAKAMAQVSGCKVTVLLGDQAQQYGRLDCGNGTPPPLSSPPARYDCMQFPTGIKRPDGWEYVDYECRPY